MPDLADVTNEFIRAEIDEFVDRPDEREHLVGLFARTTPAMQEIAAALIDADHSAVDDLTRAALDSGTPAVEVLDNGLIAGMAVVGIKFREGDIFVPEVLASARAMKAAPGRPTIR